MRAAIPLALELDVLGVGHQMPAAPLTRLRALPWLLHEVVSLAKYCLGWRLKALLPRYILWAASQRAAWQLHLHALLFGDAERPRGLLVRE